MSVLFIAGSPTPVSRSASLLATISSKMAGHGLTLDQLSIRNLDAQALVLADFQHPDILRATEQVCRARVVVIATPIYKAAYSGLLKTLLDLLPQKALKGKTVLPLATGGSPHHMLALDYALRPILQSLGARQVLSSIYATDAEVQMQTDGSALLSEDLEKRINDAVKDILSESLEPATA